MNVGDSTSVKSSYTANLSYSQTEFKGMLNVGGKEYNAEISIERLSFEFKMESTYRSASSFLGEGVLKGFEDFKKFDMSKIDEILKNIDTQKIGYEGKDLDKLSSQEANDLLGKDGFFSIENTSKRIADFVLNGAGDNVEMLKSGREGVYRGLKLAEEAWGGKLPDIAYETLREALNIIDAKFEELGIPLIDDKA